MTATHNTASPGLLALQELTHKDMEAVNALIKRRVRSRISLIPEIAGHLIKAGGKRLRPMVSLAFARLCGYQGAGHVSLATAVEFMHSATLLHDDVVDESDLRRGAASARKLWGNQASVLVGDFLLGQAFRMMVDAESHRALEILANASVVIAEGEVLQLDTARDRLIDEARYMAVIDAKTAELFAAACEVGPVLAGAAPAICAAARAYGLHLGRAFQLVDDVLDYGGQTDRMGKQAGDDFRSDKITLPLIVAMELSCGGERAFLEEILHGRARDTHAFERTRQIMINVGALEKVGARAAHHGSEAIAALDLLPSSKERTALQDAVTFCLHRLH